MIGFAQKRGIIVQAECFNDFKLSDELAQKIAATGETVDVTTTGLVVHKSIGDIAVPLGNWLIFEENTDKQYWSIEPNIFAKTYTDLGQGRFLKTPIVNQYVHFEELSAQNVAEILAFANGKSLTPAEFDDLIVDIDQSLKQRCILIATLEGVEQVRFGDYLVKGINGEVYPVKPENFDRVYTKLAIE